VPRGPLTPAVVLRHNVAVPTRGTVFALGVKRLLDVSLGIALAAVALPLMVPIGLAIRIDSPGPALFRPTRIGKRGKPFAMFKFRTMVKGAEDRLQEFAHLNLADGMTKIPDDPRVTRIGKWLRRYSLDELPQILNIVAGQMSFVGPRPHDVHELPRVGLEEDPRLSVRPGLTGLWQVSARSDPSVANRVHHDLQYVHRWSLLLDAKILTRTVPAVLLGRGGLVNGGPSAVANGHPAGSPRFASSVLDSPRTAQLALSGAASLSPAQNGAIVIALTGGPDLFAPAVDQERN
jgi:lipopolysaccharide/colanic/teichoic acid biosynthesis glycosyltransferase